MIKNYRDAIGFIEQFKTSNKEYNLDSFKMLMAKLKNPQAKLKYVHVAGTNGKGSTSNYLAQILQQAGYKTGLYTSPHIIDVKERIKVNGKLISEKRFKNICYKIEQETEHLKKMGLEFCWFEIITAIAFVYFKEKKCDIVVLEAGIGGAIDPTNIIPASNISIITKIAKDHTKILGKTKREIAKQKAGIIKRNNVCIMLKDRNKIVANTIRNICIEKDAKLIMVENPKSEKTTNNKIKFEYKNHTYKIKTQALYQVKNAVLAIATAKYLNVSNRAISKALLKVKLQARFERINKNPDIYLDGAHNPNAIENLFKGVDYRDVVAIVSFLNTKDYKASIKKIPKLRKIIFTTLQTNKGVDPKVLKNIAQNQGKNAEFEKNQKKAIQKAIKYSKKEGKIIIFGSFYLASDIKKIIKKQTIK